MAHFVMVCEGKHPIMPLASGPDLPGNWRMGTPITGPVPQPLRYELDPDYGGNPKAMYGSAAIPVMRDDVVRVLQSVGVDNLELFDAVLVNPATGAELRDYKAYNIVGLVAATDRGTSRQFGGSADRGDADYDGLVIDEAKAEASGKRLFRLAENVSAIVVHDAVKQAIEAAGIPGFEFYGPGEWSG